MGTVLAAEHTLLRQRVALKFLDATGPTVLERFGREARAASRIESEHICRVMDLGTLDDDAPYIVMEMLTGTDLAGRLRTHAPVPVGDAADYVLQALDALVEAHARGIVHRGLKPSNLFLARRSDGTEILKVLDFGISKLEAIRDLGEETAVTEVGVALSDAPGSGSGPVMTETGSLMGSPPYVSPEQLRSTRDVDARTDIWALGVILYELVAGVRPFRGDTRVALFEAILAGSYLPLRTCCPSVPPDFEALVDSCLRVDMYARCPSAIVLAEGLVPFVPDGEARVARARRVSGTSSQTRPPSSSGTSASMGATSHTLLVEAGTAPLAHLTIDMAPAGHGTGSETGGPVALDRANGKRAWAGPVVGAIGFLAVVVAGACRLRRERAAADGRRDRAGDRGSARTDRAERASGAVRPGEPPCRPAAPPAPRPPPARPAKTNDREGVDLGRF